MLTSMQVIVSPIRVRSVCVQSFPSICHLARLKAISRTMSLSPCGNKSSNGAIKHCRALVVVGELAVETRTFR